MNDKNTEGETLNRTLNDFQQLAKQREKFKIVNDLQVD
jgi:hypothetical protein